MKAGVICFAGNANLKIYGTLKCASGKRMKKANRVFFVSGEEALLHHFRPCALCMSGDYKHWKLRKKRVESSTPSSEI
jgi:methylphosphotriester-DNA--protein-cysteine methyltransferase